jgi:hypothetical protein
MDPVTHSLAGATICNLGFRRKLSMLVLILSSTAPESRVVKNFLYFAKYPYAQVRTDKDRMVVIWS